MSSPGEEALLAGGGRGAFAFCANLALAVDSVARCVKENGDCAVDVDAGNRLSALEANAAFVDEAGCRDSLDACLADIYGQPADDYPAPGEDPNGGPASSASPRDPSTCNSDVSCDFSPQCDPTCLGGSCESGSCDGGSCGSSCEAPDCSGCSSSSGDSGGSSCDSGGSDGGGSGGDGGDGSGCDCGGGSGCDCGGGGGGDDGGGGGGGGGCSGGSCGGDCGGCSSGGCSSCAVADRLRAERRRFRCLGRPADPRPVERAAP